MFRNITRKYSSFTNIKYHQGLSKVNIFRENRSYGKENRVKAIQKFYDITRCDKNENIDSHDNSLYMGLNNIYIKDSKMHPHIENKYGFSAKHLVDDFNRRRNKDMTMKQYFEN